MYSTILAQCTQNQTNCFLALQSINIFLKSVNKSYAEEEFMYESMDIFLRFVWQLSKLLCYTKEPK